MFLVFMQMDGESLERALALGPVDRIMVIQSKFGELGSMFPYNNFYSPLFISELKFHPCFPSWCWIIIPIFYSFLRISL